VSVGWLKGLWEALAAPVGMGQRYNAPPGIVAAIRMDPAYFPVVRAAAGRDPGQDWQASTVWTS